VSEKKEKKIHSKQDSNSTQEDFLEENSSLENSIPNSQEPQIDYEDKFLRVQAEVQNIQQRFAKEQVNWRMYDGSKLAQSILPALDNLERALQVEVADDNSKQLKTGVEMVYKTLQNALSENNVVSFGKVGEKFDPTIHQAVQKIPSQNDQQPSDTIAQVLQKGYKISDRTIRTAMVAVYQN
jgi:molecular chaperone GrpE